MSALEAGLAREPGMLLALAIVLVAGAVSGALVRRIHLPAVTGQILAGILLGPAVLGVLHHSSIQRLQPITHFALGLIAVAVGNHLQINRLRNATRRLLLLVVLEATLTPALVAGAVLLASDAGWTMASLLAALAVSTAPATIVAIVKETRSKGVFVKTLVAAVALNNIACILLFEAAHAAARVSLDPQGGHSLAGVLLAPLWQLGSAALLGGLAGVVLVRATRRVVRPDRLATASIIAILLTAGIAEQFRVSSLLACLFLGVMLANLTPDKDEIGHRVFDNFESAILAAFFTLAGMELDFGYLVPGGLLALLLVGARFLGKVASAGLAMRLAVAIRPLRRYLGMALVPQAGVAVGLLLLVKEDPALKSISGLLLAVGLTSVTINEIIGPVMTRFALGRSGDVGRDRARLIDFLHEENIVTELEADTKEEAIAKLTDLLISSHNLECDREQLLESVLDRERDMSTCVGAGLAVPHGVLEQGDSMVGVMGISSRGLQFETPDGRPVHCMVLLATPSGDRTRHLEVLAALAQAIGRDEDIQRQLYHTKSAAHAYELLHAEDAESFNRYLED